jgi:hypothetical protein
MQTAKHLPTAEHVNRPLAPFARAARPSAVGAPLVHIAVPPLLAARCVERCSSVASRRVAARVLGRSVRSSARRQRVSRHGLPNPAFKRTAQRRPPLNANVKRLPSVMNQGHSVNRCEASCGGSQGMRAGHRRAVGRGQRGLSVRWRPAYGLRCASRFVSGHPSVAAASGAAARNTGLGLGAVVASSTNTPNHSVKRTA